VIVGSEDKEYKEGLSPVIWGGGVERIRDPQLKEVSVLGPSYSGMMVRAASALKKVEK